MTTMPQRDLRTLPKAHLHLHLEGAMRPGTLQELAETHHVEVPRVRGYGSFAAFAGMYLAACEVLRRPEDLGRLVREVAEDGQAAGATWIEVALYLPRHRARLGPEEAVLEIIRAAAERAAAETGVGVGIMVTADRTVSPDDAVRQAHIAARYVGRGVVAFGLANDEARFPPEPFAPAFAVARAAGLISAPHAGELAGPASVRGALDALGAQRIEHGVRAAEDPALVREISERGVTLDMCPTSNVLLSVVPSLAEHPLPSFLAAGVRVSLNSDDPLFFGAGLVAEYELCRTAFGLSDEVLAGIARASIEGSGAPVPLKRTSLKGIDAWLSQE